MDVPCVGIELRSPKTPTKKELNSDWLKIMAKLPSNKHT